jgi:aminoglycoside phosphotransferase
VTPRTGPAAGVHLPWAEVPDTVQAWAAAVGGGRPTAVRDLQGGFSPGAATRLDCPGSSIFVKAVGAELNPDSPDLHRREAVVSAALPASSRVPRLLGTFDDGDWVALAFEAIDGRLPAHPWDGEELHAVVHALTQLHCDLTPSPAPFLDSAASYLRPLFGGWADLAAMDAPPPGLDEWARRHLDRLAELESGWPDASTGDTLVHGDIRSDNILLGPTGVVFVDWPHAAIGTPVLDLVEWAPSVRLEGGPEPEDLLARHEGAGVADPEVVTVLLAAVSGFFVEHSLRPPPPGLPTVRPFQAAQGTVALAWLRRRTGW